jgi:hypothetical protein
LLDHSKSKEMMGCNGMVHRESSRECFRLASPLLKALPVGRSLLAFGCALRFLPLTQCQQVLASYQCWHSWQEDHALIQVSIPDGMKRMSGGHVWHRLVLGL